MASPLACLLNAGCLSFLCPCIPFGQVAEVLDKGMTSCGLAGLLYCLLLHAGVAVVPCHCIYTCTYRRKLRAAYDLPPEPCADCCVHMWCGPCAISQMYRELKNRGADPAMGWEVLSKKTTMAPVPMQDMTR
ncbi:cell number regulator 4 isoform X3 [Zea mays]|uniref:cell number regulator 4 isoform X3 n=1 Tax=Zea mays TaxID=4577 RepID=UPI0004DEA923|nr:cell number regulator 4 isoform X3 [Zea mays]|eukprot:XP_008646745.1 cell number regulator 4 isoform X3 [Zea mays]